MAQPKWIERLAGSTRLQVLELHFPAVGGSGNSACEFADPAISMSIAVTAAFSAFHNARIRSA